MIDTLSCKINEIDNFMTQYKDALSSPIESFLEDHILSSQFYIVILDKKKTGYFAIYKNDLLTQFFIEVPFRSQSQKIYEYVLKNHSIKFAFVPTCDEFFLSHALDEYEKIEKQAFFFQDIKGNAQIENIRNEVDYRLATSDDKKSMIRISNDFLDNINDQIKKKQIYVGHQNNELVAIGIIEKSKFLENHASIGLFTHERFRRHGIGKSTIAFLKKACYSDNLIPVAGCWYLNKASKMTLESAGMHTSSRLLKVIY
jgi:hypothetical protein